MWGVVEVCVVVCGGGLSEREARHEGGVAAEGEGRVPAAEVLTCRLMGTPASSAEEEPLGRATDHHCLPVVSRMGQASTMILLVEHCNGGCIWWWA